MQVENNMQKENSWDLFMQAKDFAVRRSLHIHERGILRFYSFHIGNSLDSLNQEKLVYLFFLFCKENVLY